MYFLIALNQLIASGTHLIGKSLTNSIEPPVILFFRVLIVCIVFTLFFLFKKGVGIKKIDKSDIPLLLLLGFVNIPVNQFLFLQSLEYTSAPHVSLAYALTPAFVFLIAFLFMKERTSYKKVVGILLAIGGTIVVLLEKKFNFSSDTFLGDILALMAAFSWAIYTVLGKNFTMKYGAIYSTFLSMLVGFVMYIPIFILLPEQIHLEKFSTINWLQVFYLGAITSGVGYALWYYVLGKMDASKVSVFNNIQPILTAIFAFVLFGTNVTAYFVIGGVLVIAGVYLTQKG